MSVIEKLRNQFEILCVDAILVYNEINCRYLSGFSYHDGAFLITKNAAHLLTDFRYGEAAEKAVSKFITVTTTKNRKEYIKEALSSSGCKRVGFEGSYVSFSDFNRLLSDYPDIEFIDIKDTLDKLRAVKSESEINSIKTAQGITDQAFSDLLGKLNVNMTEIEVAAELDYIMRRLGADGNAFSTIAVSGDASSLPHGVPRNVKLKHGFLTLDFGAMFNGYCSDMTRTVCIGRADDAMNKLYNTVLAAQRSALDFIKAGVLASDADKCARVIIESVDEYKSAFGHSLGHSVGLEVHESPSLSPRNTDIRLEVGNVVTVEPGIYLAGKYGCRIEDLVVVTESGIMNLTKSPKELIEIY